MAYPVLLCNSPRVFDTLPVLKARYYAQVGTASNIYSFARFYFLSGGLQLSMCAFEREPAATSHVAFSLYGEGEHMLLLTLNPCHSGVFLLPAHPMPQLWNHGGTIMPHTAPQRFAGVDEQGWYWGGQFMLPHSLLQKAGLDPSNGAQYRAAVLKYKGGIFQGASHTGAPLDARAFDTYEVVSP